MFERIKKTVQIQLVLVKSLSLTVCIHWEQSPSSLSTWDSQLSKLNQFNEPAKQTKQFNRPILTSQTALLEDRIVPPRSKVITLLEDSFGVLASC